MARPGNTNTVKSGVWVKNPLIALQCYRCAAKDHCPKVNADPSGRCWYELNDETPDLETSEGILALLQQKVEIDYIRYQRALRYQAAMGSQSVDRDSTSLSNTITKDLQILAEMSVRFGTIKTEGGQSLTPPSSSINIESVNILKVTQQEFDQCQVLQEELKLLREQRKLVEAQTPVSPKRLP